jgi:hypothetical protein
MKSKKDNSLDGFIRRGFLFIPKKGGSPGLLAAINKVHSLPGEFLFLVTI